MVVVECIKDKTAPINASPITIFIRLKEIYTIDWLFII